MTAFSDDLSDLFSRDGVLNGDRLATDAVEVLDACTEWLRTIGRGVYLPIDLLAVLLGRGHTSLERVVVGASRPGDGTAMEQLRALARRVERETDQTAQLKLDNFSLGFTGILTDALHWAREAGRARMCEADLVRVMRWRAELQESASIRWALRQLAQPGGELLFEVDGELRRAPFTTHVWGSLEDGMRLSARSGLAFLGSPHVIAATALRGGILAAACDAAGVSPRRLHSDLLGIVGDRQPQQPEFALNRQTLTPRLVRMLVAAARSAESRGRPIGEVELLGAFIGDGGSSLDLVTALGITPHLRHLLEDGGRGEPHRRVAVGDGDKTGPTSLTPTLDQLGRDLTADAAAGTLPVVLGRDAELQRVINVLMRSEQRNPLLTGSAGVGKTALAAALAQRIFEGSVPDRLAGMRVIEINGAALVGGTSYRGELEARIQSLLTECEERVILFIDEAHAVFAPRSSSGQPAEIPNHFKAALASGKIAVIAATTEAEFRRWIEDDPALRRRFERIRLEELSPELTRTILVHLAPRFEDDYKVTVTPDAVDAAIELSSRFMPEQALPDKAKKLLMDATISVASEIALARKRPQVATSEHDTPSKRVVTRLDVARQVAMKTGAPLDRIARGAISWWVGLEDRLKHHVVGQERAVREVAQSLVAGRLNNTGRRRPQSVFVFVGPAGVGKSDLARALAEEIFGNREALLQLEMGDFAEPHAISRLIGTPPGYVGYQDEDALVTPLRRAPSRVVLLQDFPLAHPRVQERLLRVFEEGELSDTRGLKADVSHAIFVLTVAHEPSGSQSIGFGRGREPDARELLRRVDASLADRLKGRDLQVIVFDGVRDSGGELAELLLRHRMAQFCSSLRSEYEIELVVTAAAEADLVRRVRELEDARGIETVFRDLVVVPVTTRLLNGVASTAITLTPDGVVTTAAVAVSDPVATEPTADDRPHATRPGTPEPEPA